MRTGDQCFPRRTNLYPGMLPMSSSEQEGKWILPALCSSDRRRARPYDSTSRVPAGSVRNEAWCPAARHSSSDVSGPACHLQPRLVLFLMSSRPLLRLKRSPFPLPSVRTREPSAAVTTVAMPFCWSKPETRPEIAPSPDSAGRHLRARSLQVIAGALPVVERSASCPSDSAPGNPA